MAIRFSGFASGTAVTLSVTHGGNTEMASVASWGNSGGPVAPVLSSPLGSATGQNSADISVVTDKAGGTMYWFVSPSATPPAIANLKAGIGSTAFGSSSVSTTGRMDFAVAGLAPSTTYYAHFLQTDADLLDSNVASLTGGFTTDTAGSGSGTVTLSVLKRGGLQIAPEGIWFQASISAPGISEDLTFGNYDESFHHAIYRWDFGDSGAAGSKNTNVPNAQNNLNIAGGKHVAHVYRSPGTYTATCTVYDQSDGSLIGSDTIQVTVGNTETLFTGTRTICVSTGSNFAGAPAGAQQVTSLSAGVSALMALSGTGRILLRAGETHSWGGVGLNANYDNFYLATFGGAGQVTINTNGSGAINVDQPCDVVVSGNIRFDGGWDSTTEAGTHNLEGQHVLRMKPGMTNASYVLLDGIEATGFGQCVAVNGISNSNLSPSLILNDCLVENWGQYGMYVGGGKRYHIGVIGSGFIQAEQANQGGAGRGTGIANEEGPIRIVNAQWVFIDASDIFNRTGFETANSTLGGSIPSCQPAIRLFTGLNGNPDVPRAIVTRNTIENGYYCIDLRQHLSTQPTRPVLGLIEKNIMTACYQAQSLFRTYYAGLHLRNNIIVRPNTEWPRSKANNAWVQFLLRSPDTDFTTAGNGGFELALYNNTLIDYLSPLYDKDAEPGLLQEQLSAVYNNNNIYWTPNNTYGFDPAPNLTSTAIPVVGGGNWDPHWKGYKWRSDSPWDLAPGYETMQSDSSNTPPASIIAEYRPNPGSPVLSDSTGVTAALEDFYGNLRNGPIAARARGAQEQS